MKKLVLTLLIAASVLISASVTYAQSDEEIRSQVANLGATEFIWNAANFAGLYYDLDEDLGTEQITFRLTQMTPESAALSDMTDADGNRGIFYTTSAQAKQFKFKPWGEYMAIGFLGDEYFAAYDEAVTPFMQAALIMVPFLYDKSKVRNLMANEQLSNILIDDDTERIITGEEPLKLKDGYELAIKSINANETKVMLELKRDEEIVDTKIIAPGVDGATLADKTYYYKKNLGNAGDIVTIAVHVKNVFHGTDYDSATVDGIFQVSDIPTSIKPDQQFGTMSIRTVDPTALAITMDNKDNQIILSKNKDISLMKDFHIETANQNVIDETDPLRYYLYKEAKCDFKGPA